MSIKRFFGSMLLFLSLLGGARSAPEILDQYIPKKSDKVIVVNKENQYLKAFQYIENKWVQRDSIAVSTGLHKGDKEYFGDRRTPQGIYTITEVVKGNLGKLFGPVLARINFPNSYDKKHVSVRYKNKSPYALHGTNEPEYIGRRRSHGCIRMKNEDAIKLYNKGFLAKGVPVIILPEEENESFYEEMEEESPKYFDKRPVYVKKSKEKSNEDEVNASTFNIEKIIRDNYEKDKKSPLKTTLYGILSLSIVGVGGAVGLKTLVRKMRKGEKRPSSYTPPLSQLEPTSIENITDKALRRREGKSEESLLERIIDLYKDNYRFSEIRDTLMEEGYFELRPTAREVKDFLLYNLEKDPTLVKGANRYMYDGEIARTCGYDNYIVDMYMKGVKLDDITNNFKEETGMSVSVSTIYRILKNNGIKPNRRNGRSSKRVKNSKKNKSKKGNRSKKKVLSKRKRS